MLRLGFDVGGTKTSIKLFECVIHPFLPKEKVSGYLIPLQAQAFASVAEVATHRFATERDLGYGDYLERLSVNVKEFLEKIGLPLSQITSMGFGMPGSVDPHSGVMIQGNSQMFRDKNFLSDLKQKLNFHGGMFVDNDANCFALAEFLCGAGVLHQKKSNVTLGEQVGLGIILGTGVGGGIVMGGDVLRGKNGSAGEFGHTIFYWDGPDCFCGQKGCVELYLSGTGLERQFEELSGMKAKGFEIFLNAKRENSSVSAQMAEKYKQDLYKFLGNLVNLFDPDFIVLGGGVSRENSLYENINKQVSERNFLKKETAIYQHQISDDAGALGAALLGLELNL